MTKSKGYQWTLDGPLPLLEDHSRAKHDVLRAYLVNYLRILALSPKSAGVRVTLVDGFAGGGLYRSLHGEPLPGSPLVLLEAVREARARVAIERKERGLHGDYTIEVQVHLVEETPSTVAFLERLIKDRGDLLDKHTQVRIHAGTFEKALPNIFAAIKAEQRGGRSVFIIDQYGWSQVNIGLVRQIFDQLPRAEVFLTWMIDNLINFVSEQTVDKLNPGLEKAGLSPYLDAQTLLNLKRDTQDKKSDLTWRRAIQTLLADELRRASGAAFRTPFYIVPQESRRGYWLLHLAQHLRANEEMKRIHWQNNNLHHPGGPGLNMLGYVGAGGQLAFDHQFDQAASVVTHEALREDIPRRLREWDQPVRFGDLVAHTANDTPAQRSQMQEAVFALAQGKQVTVRTVSGSTRRGASGLADDDVVELPLQLWLIPPG
jgi:three-Cys-motif partner protein